MPPAKPLSLLDLPVEIRLQIYKYLIASFNWGSRIHFLLTSQPNPLYPPSLGSGQLSYTPCRYTGGAPDVRITNSIDLFRWCNHYETCRGWHVRNGTPPALQGTYLSIFLTCKTINHEATPLLYKLHSFIIPSIPTLYAFLTTVPLSSLTHLTTLTLTLTIPPSYLNPPPQIFYIGPDTQKTQYITSIFLLSQLPRLNNLTINIYNTTWRHFLEDEMLLPLHDIRVLAGGSFTVTVPYQAPPPTEIHSLWTTPTSTFVARERSRYEALNSPRTADPSSPEYASMKLIHRARDLEPVIGDTNIQITAPITTGIRRKRKCIDVFGWCFNNGVWGAVGLLVFCPFVAVAILWDLLVVWIRLRWE